MTPPLATQAPERLVETGGGGDPACLMFGNHGERDYLLLVGSCVSKCDWLMKAVRPQ